MLENTTSTTWNCSFCNPTVVGDTLKISLMVLLIVTITVGNIVSLLVFMRTRQLRTSQGFLKTSLALADLAVGLFVIPYSVYKEVIRIVYGLEEGDGHSSRFNSLFPCFIMGPLYAGCTFVSISTIFLLSVERSFAVLRPLHKKMLITRRRTGWFIVFSWVLSFFLAMTPILFGRGITLEYNFCSKMCNYVFITDHPQDASWNIMLIFPVFDFSILGGTFAINFITFAAIRQYCKVRKQLEMDVQSTCSKVSFSDITAAKTIGILTFAFSASFSPIAVFVVGNVLGYPWCEFSFYAFWILTSNSCWNVVIYSVRDLRFRQGVRELFSRQTVKSPTHQQRPPCPAKEDSSSQCVAVLKEIFRPETA
ncbi:adenosine receptor A3-like [Pelobates cultripes]|uniref:Adenosine receptor A3-like n=1 Tax=Pelobates cultripes TaxID=61616 RepID=A0AAD1S4W7_PELCU|nr:adenosine receptor A3-like [Pelobates cultripes]